MRGVTSQLTIIMRASWPASSGAVCCLLITILSGLRLAEGKPQVDYAPGDTQVLDYTAFCEDLTLRYTDPVSIGPSAVYALDSKPVLTDGDSFNFHLTEALNNSSRYYDWNLHFYEDSTIDVSACVNGNGSAEYFLIQGKESFDDWVNSQVKSPSVVDTFVLDNSCAEANYTINEEDQYFVVFTLIEEKVVNLSLNITFNRRKHAVENKYNTKHYFNASTSTAIQTPLNQSSFIVLVYGNSSESPENWNTLELNIEVNCMARVWLYAVTVIGPALVLLLCIVCIVCCVCCIRRSKRCSPEDSPLLRNWDDDTESHSYYQYSNISKRLDPLTELAIATPGVSNPHIAQFKEDIKSPSFQDDYLAVGSPKFSTFKPVN